MGKRSQRLKAKKRNEKNFYDAGFQDLLNRFETATKYYDNDGYDKDILKHIYDRLVENEKNAGSKGDKDLYNYVGEKVVRDLFNDYSEDNRNIRILSDAQAENIRNQWYKETGELLDWEKLKFGQYNDKISEYLNKLKEGLDKELGASIISAFFGS